MDVSIIVVAWNVKRLVYDCLKSVYDETMGIDFEVIYVDNASEDGSVEMVRKEFPQVRIIENSENKGFIIANNQAIEVASGRYVLLLNSDTIVLDNAIAKTVAFADQNTDVAVVGCKVLNADRTLQRNCFMYPSLLNMLLSATYLYKVFPQSRFFGRERMTWWNNDDVRDVDVVCGCFSLVRKEAVDQVGLMDIRYFVFGDDPDWCFRFKKAGWKIRFTPHAEIIHYGGQTTRQRAGAFILQLYGSILIFMRLHRSGIAFQCARILTALFFMVRVPYWLCAAVFRKGIRSEAFETAKAYTTGFVYCLTNWRRMLMNQKDFSREVLK